MGKGWRRRDGQIDKEMQCGTEVVVVVGWAVPHSGVVDKNREEYLGSKQSPSPRPDLTAQGCSPGR